MSRMENGVVRIAHFLTVLGTGDKEVVRHG
jgi:hypothetical protein